MTPADTASADQEAAQVRAAQRGDADAVRALVDRYDRRLLYFLLRFLPAEEALDALQDVWLTMVRRLASLRAAGAFRVWLYQIAHARAVSVLRRARREEAACERLRDELPLVSDNGDEPHLDRADLVHRALADLSPEHREVLLLRFLEDMPLDDIAQALRLSPGTVKSRLHYARAALRRHVERLSDDRPAP
jgi:RNA polymerase sigma-70 factor (ECF subfamily)